MDRPFSGEAKRLLDRELASGGLLLAAERELENAVLVLGRARALVELDRQGEAAIQVAVEALGAQHPLAILLLGLALRLRGDRDLVALDRDVNVFLLHARNLR